MHHGDAIAFGDDLVHVTADHHHRRSLVCETTNQAVDVGLRAHVDTLRRLVEDDDAWLELQRACHPQCRARGRQGGPRPDRRVEADETLAGIKDGAIHGTVVQQPYEFGYQAIRRMAQAVRGDRSFIPDTKQIIVPTLVVTRADVDGFMQRINTLRGR